MPTQFSLSKLVAKVSFPYISILEENKEKNTIYPPQLEACLWLPTRIVSTGTCSSKKL
jgi:hypothetical protein